MFVVIVLWCRLLMPSTMNLCLFAAVTECRLVFHSANICVVRVFIFGLSAGHILHSCLQIYFVKLTTDFHETSDSPFDLCSSELVNLSRGFWISKFLLMLTVPVRQVALAY